MDTISFASFKSSPNRSVLMRPDSSTNSSQYKLSSASSATTAILAAKSARDWARQSRPVVCADRRGRPEELPADDVTGAAVWHCVHELDDSKRKALRAILELLWRHQTSVNRQWLVPANRLFVQIDVDLLRFQVLLDAPGAELPSEAGLFLAAPRCFDVCRLHVINPDDAGPQRLHRPQRPEDVTRPHRRCKPVGCVIGDADGVLLVRKGNYSGHGAEDLLARDAGAVCGVVEDRRLHVIALCEGRRPSASDRQLGFGLADLQIRVDALVLFLADQRSHLGFAREWRAELDAFRLLGHGLHEPRVDGALYEDAAASRANLALVDEDAEQRAVDSRFEVGVGEEYVGRLAAEFQRDPLHRVGRHSDDHLADRRAASEGNLIHVAVLHERRAGSFTESGDDVDHSGRQTFLCEPVRHFEDS